MINDIRFTSKITIAASLVLVLVIGLFTINNFTVMRSQTQEQLSSVLSEVSQSVSNNISNWLNSKLNIVVAVSDAYNSNDTKSEILEKLYLADGAGDFKNVFIGREDGSFVLDDQSVALPSDYDARQRPWYQLAKSSRTTAFTAPYIDVTTNELTISAVAPINVNGRFTGVAGGDIDMATISKIVNSIDFLGYGYGFLVDANSRILSHPKPQYNDKQISELLGRKLPLSETFRQIEVNDKSHLISFVRITGIKNVEWYLGVLIDEDVAYASVDSFRTMAFVYMLAGVIAIVVMMHYLLKYLMKPMTKVTEAIKDIAQGEGDLRQRLEVENRDEFGELSEYFNLFIEKIHGSITQVHNTTHSIEDSMKRLVDKTDSSQALYSEQSQLTSAVVTAINELASSAQEISNNASEASKLATDASGQVITSQSSLQTNINSINQLSEKMRGAEEEVLQLEQHTANIGQVLEVIKGVSEQTNLLALNAAIEAARAGEAGRGFAVVADEVRQLAQRTQESTAEIEQTIARLQDGASSAVSIMKESLRETETSVSQAITAGEQMEMITKIIASIDETNNIVANATNEQTTVTSSIDRDIHEMSSITKMGQQNLSEVASECSALKEEFFELENMVDRFKV